MIRQTRCWTMCAAVMLGAIMGTGALADPRDPGVPLVIVEQAEPLFPGLSMDATVLRSQAAYRDPSVFAAPPDRNGGCQQDGTFVNQITGAGVIANGSLGWPCDNFRPAGAAPVTLTAISFSAGGGLNATLSANIELDDFRIVIYDDDNGLPNFATPRATFDVSTGAGTLVKTPFFQFNVGTTPNVATITMNDYTATVTPTVLPAGQCYWVEIQTTSPSFGAADVLWTQPAPASEGDGSRRQRLRTGNFAAAIDVLGLNDMHFCMNFPLEPNNTGALCPVRTLLSCNGQAGARCQKPDGTNNIVTAQRGTAFAADNFSVSQPTTITGGCFFGNYNGTAPALTAESFQVRIYKNSATGIPDSANVVATVTATGAGVTPNLTRTASANFANSFYYEYTLAAPISLTPGCYWIEVQKQGTTPAWRWFLTQNVRSATQNDGVFITVASTVSPPTIPTYAVGGRAPVGDFVWCLKTSSGAIERSSGCPAQQTPTNTACATAISMPLTGVPTAGESNFGPIPGPLPPNGPIPDLYTNPFGLWYSVVGDGATVRVSTCNSGGIPGVLTTTVDTVINVYCTTDGMNPCAGTLTWIAGNDQANPACAASAAAANASAISFPTISGATYLIYVQGFEDNALFADAGASRGYWYVSATSDLTPVATPPSPCADLHLCRIEIPPGAIASAEACGSAVEQDNGCSNATVLNLGQWGTGTLFGFQNGVDVDSFKIIDPTPVPGSKFYTVTIITETLADIIVGGRGPCVNDDFPGIIFPGGVLPCFGINEFTFQDVLGGDLFVSLQAAGERAPTCGAGGAGNRYLIKVEVADVGVCCRASATSCEVTPNEDPTLMRVTADAFNTCTALGGTYLGDGTVCDMVSDPGNPRLPCDVAGGPPVAATLGVCCTEIGTCTTATDTACPPAQFIPGGVCTPDPCTTIAAGRCCDDSGNCLVVRASDCSPSAVFTLGVFTCSPHPCPQPVVCCRGAACTVEVPTDCTGGATPGTVGTGSSCSPTNPCGAPTTDNCCRGTTCNPVTAGTCTGLVAGSNSLVRPSCGAGTAFASCCYADFNHDGSQSIDDLFLYFNAYFTSSPWAKFGGNGVAQPAIDDLFLYINAYFGTCS